MNNTILITHASDNRGSKEFSGVCVTLSVCMITQKQMIPKCSNLVKEMMLGYPTSGMILGSKGQKSQGHKVQKTIKWPA